MTRASIICNPLKKTLKPDDHPERCKLPEECNHKTKSCHRNDEMECNIDVVNLIYVQILCLKFTCGLTDFYN